MLNDPMRAHGTHIGPKRHAALSSNNPQVSLAHSSNAITAIVASRGKGRTQSLQAGPRDTFLLRPRVGVGGVGERSQIQELSIRMDEHLRYSWGTSQTVSN